MHLLSSLLANLLQLSSLQFGLRKGSLELSSRNLLREDFIQFFVSATSSLGLAEPQVDEAENCKASEDEGYLRTEVGLVGIEEVGYHK